MKRRVRDRSEALWLFLMVSEITGLVIVWPDPSLFWARVLFIVAILGSLGHCTLRRGWSARGEDRRSA